MINGIAMIKSIQAVTQEENRVTETELIVENSCSIMT